MIETMELTRDELLITLASLNAYINNATMRQIKESNLYIKAKTLRDKLMKYLG